MNLVKQYNLNNYLQRFIKATIEILCKNLFIFNHTWTVQFHLIIDQSNVQLLNNIYFFYFFFAYLLTGCSYF